MSILRSRTALAAVSLLGLFTLAPRDLSAAGQARISGTIRDESKTPLADVKITVTCPDVASIRIDTKSDAKGKWAVSLVDSTKSFHYRFEKDGYQPNEMDLKLAIGSNERRDITLQSAAAVVAAASAGESTPENNAAIMFNEGVEALRMGDDVTAMKKMNDALVQNPDLLQAHEALAILHVNGKRYAEAAAEAEQVLAVEPRNEKALRVAVEAYRQLGDKAKQAAAQAALGELDPKVAATDLYNEGVNAYNAGEMKKALDHFRKSAEKNPEFPKVHYMTGMCLVSEGKNAEARAAMEQFIAKAAPDDPDLSTAKEMLAFLK